MATPKKKPQDHLKPVEPDEELDTSETPFEFEHDGKTFQLAVPQEVLTIGWARKRRHLSATDQLFDLLEAIADEDALAAIDEMQAKEFTQFQTDFFAHSGVSLGES